MDESNENLKMRVVQFIKFAAVGVSNTLIYLVIYYALLYFSMPYILANGVGFLISVINAYFLNKKYVFSTSTKNQIGIFLKVILCYLITFLASTCILYIIVSYLKVSAYLAPLINLVFTVPLNFFLNKYWAFK